MAVNKDAIGILFGVAGGGAVNSESYNEINRGLNAIVNNINSKDPKFIKLHIDDEDFDKEVEKVKEKVKDIAIGTSIKVASGESAASLTQAATAAKAAAEAAKQETKAQQNATEKINKKKAAYEAAIKALKEYRQAIESASKAKGSKQIRIDENGMAYTDSKRMAGMAAKINASYQQTKNALSESSLDEMGKRNAASIIKKNTALKAEVAELMTNFRVTTSEAEAQRAAELDAVNRRQSVQVDAARDALDAMQKYRDALQEIAEAGTVSFNGKRFLPTQEVAQAVQDAEKLNAALQDAAEAMKSPSLTDSGRNGVLSSYGEEINNLIRQLDPVIKKEHEEAKIVDEETQKRKNANIAVLETIKALQTLKALKTGTDDIRFDNGFFSIDRIAKFADKGHTEDLQSAVEHANKAIVNLKSVIGDLGADKSVAKGNKYFVQMRELIREIDQEITQAAKDAEEARSIIREVLPSFTSGLRNAKKSGDQSEVQQWLDDINKFALNIARTNGAQYANEFLQSIEKRTRVKMKFIGTESTYGESRPVHEANGARVEMIEQQVTGVEAALAEAMSLAKDQGRDVSGIVGAIAEKIQDVKREAEEIVNSEQEAKREVEKASSAEKEKAQNKKESQKAAEGTAKAASEEANANKKASSAKKKKTDEQREAEKVMRDYYDVVLKVESAMLRTNSIGGNKENGYTFDEANGYNMLGKEYEVVKEKYDALTQDQREYLKNAKLIEAEEMKLNTAMQAKESTAQNRWSKLRDRAQQYYQDMQGVATRDNKARKMLEEIHEIANKDDLRGWDLLNEKLEDTRGYIDRNSLSIEKWYQRFRKTFDTRVRSAMAGFVTGKIGFYLRDIYNNVVEIDTAMTELKIVTRENDAALEKYAKTAEKTAQKIGASVTDLIKSTTTYARLGFSLDEAGTLSELTTAYSKVGDVSIDDATKNITGIVKAYKVGADDLEFIIDKLIYVGRNFAISSGEIGEGMNNAASSLAANGNTLNQAMGILTAANTTSQDISRASTATRTIAARLSASKQELEELGETVEADTITKLETAFKAYGIEIKNSNGELKSTYGILDAIANKWGDLSKEEQSAVIEMASGTRQQDIFLSIIENWNDAKRVVAEADGATGELSTATEERLDSIQGRIDVLKAKFEALSRSVLSSELVKLFVNIASGAVDAINFMARAIDDAIGLNTALVILAGTLLAIRVHAEIITKGAIFTFISKLCTRVQIFGYVLNKGRANAIGFGASIQKAFAHATAGVSTFQMALTGAIALISVALIAIRAYKQAQEKAIQDDISSSDENLQNAQRIKETADSVEELVEQYKKLAEEKNGIWDSDSIKEVEGIQNDIVGLVGEQAKGIDLVNGKLEDEYGLLDNISGKIKEQTLDDAKVALEKAKSAITNAMKRGGSYDFGEFAQGGDRPSYGDIITESAYSNRFYIDNDGYLLTEFSQKIKSRFDTVYGFIQQYEAVLAYERQLAREGVDETDDAQVKRFDVLTSYLEDFKDVYDQYIEAKSFIEKLTSPDNTSTVEDVDNGITSPLKSIQTILDETQDGFDGISKALTSLTEDGYLTADMLSSLVKLEKENSLGGLKLSDILIQDANGFKIAEDALQKYIDVMIAGYTITGEFATIQDKENAIENLENLRRVLYTLSRTQEKSTDATNAQKKALENQKDTLKDQLDAYKKLIDLRKKLLQQYEDELTYKKQLAEKERRVSQLQTQLAVSQLDTSAAGRAKTRQLSKDLKEAQDELDDFTLEHAIDVVTNELDTQYAEYENYINGEIDGIENRIDALSNTVSGSAGAATKTILSALSTIEKAIAGVERSPVKDDDKDSDGETTRWTSYEDAAASGFAIIRTKSEFERDDNSDIKKKYKTYQNYLDAMYALYGKSIGKIPKFHSGGIAGDTTRLKSTEMFAKLLKGEFVATPQMMNQFMTSTLPAIASRGGSTEINAPLINIQCDNVTQESLPRLEEIVNEAVKTIKRQFDDGLGRAGYHKTVKQII